MKLESGNCFHYRCAVAAGRGMEIDMKILFVGNSFTFYHDMPLLVEKIFEKTGIFVKTDQVTYGGYHLKQYLDEEKGSGQILLKKLSEESWDYIVLQEQSNTPCLEREEFLDSVLKLSAKIRENGAVPVFYQTWSYREHSDMLELIHMEHREFYQGLKDAYKEAAEKTDGILVPVGDAFLQTEQGDPEIDLMENDNYHPSLAGSFLAACMFYLKLSGKMDFPEYVPEGLDQETAQSLSEYALRAV